MLYVSPSSGAHEQRTLTSKRVRRRVELTQQFTQQQLEAAATDVTEKCVPHASANVQDSA